MQVSGIELAVGDSVRIQDQILTVIDIHGEEITFRLDPVDEGPPHDAAKPADPSRRPR